MVKLKLKKIPKKNPVIIEGFPGFGLVGTITTEFLLKHLKCQKIGSYYFEEGPATIAIHKGEAVDPIAFFYNSKYNIVIVHSISPAAGKEFQAAEVVLELAKQTGAKEIICVEGVGSQQPEPGRTFYYTTNNQFAKKFKGMKVDNLGEGIIVGVTSAVLLKAPSKTSCIFAETQSSMPDSKAAAGVIKTLDGLLGLKVDPKPLLKQAEEFESKLKGIMSQAKAVQKEKDKKTLSYVG